MSATQGLNSCWSTPLLWNKDQERHLLLLGLKHILQGISSGCSKGHITDDLSEVLLDTEETMTYPGKKATPV